MKIPPIALGLYTVYQHACEDFPQTIARVAKMGYEGVEMYGEPEQFPAELVKKTLAGYGLPLVGWHIEWKHLQPDTIESSIGFFHEVGLKNVMIPCLGGKWGVGHTPDEEKEERWDRYLKRIEEIRSRLEKEDIRLGYHNHEHEFQIHYGGQRLFDKLYQKMDPRIIMELDTGNAIEGGADPAQICAETSDRTIFLHCKPYSKQNGFDITLGDESDANQWELIVTQANNQYKWLIIECESSVLDEMENARRCIDGLKTRLTNMQE